MPEPLDPGSVIAAAEDAAAAGDHASAEQLLRDAARLQEASLGPLHPDLANTLNNLGIVCEIADKPHEAEICFRRACAIATAVLEPDHPFVATSRKNLEDFCRARGTPVDLPVAPLLTPPVGEDQDGVSTASGGGSLERFASEESRPLAPRAWSRMTAAGALIAVGLVLALIVSARFRSGDGIDASPTPGAAPGGLPSPTSAVSPPIAADGPKETSTGGIDPGREQAGPGAPVSPTVAGPPVEDAPASPTAEVESSETTARATPTPLVAVAQLCRELSTGGSDWRCATPALPVDPGPLFFYTRLRSPEATRVQHRWYRGDRLRQAVELSLRPNTTDGYRTYSRITVGAQSAGDWRVELRTGDGVLLHEERFVVR